MNESLKEKTKKTSLSKSKTATDKPLKPIKTTTKAKKITAEKPTATQALIDTIVDAIDDIRGENIVVINISKVEDSMTDYFIIAEAESGVQVKSIGENIIRRVRNELYERPINKEGFENGEWLLIDYVNVVVHIFKKDRREFYRIEDLWSDGVFTRISKVTTK